MAAHQAPPSLGFSRQEHWSGLPPPSPMHESEKGKWSHSVMSDSSRPHGLQPISLLCAWDFPGKSTGVGCHRLLMYFAYKLNKQGDNIQPWRTPFPIWNQSVVPCPVLFLPDLHTCFSRGRSGGLVFPSLSEFSTVYCDPHSQRLWHSR